jgi:hypothetical protein
MNDARTTIKVNRLRMLEKGLMFSAGPVVIYVKEVSFVAKR